MKYKINFAERWDGLNLASVTLVVCDESFAINPAGVAKILPVFMINYSYENQHIRSQIKFDGQVFFVMNFETRWPDFLYS